MFFVFINKCLFVFCIGFGYDLARRLDEHDCIVFATCLHPNKNGAAELDRLTSNRIHVIPLDVGSDKSVDGALKYVQKHCPKEGKGRLRCQSILVQNILIHVMRHYMVTTQGKHLDRKDCQSY